MTSPINFKSVVFYETDHNVDGYYFYDSFHDSDYGKILGVKGLTLPKAIDIMKVKGIDVIKNFKMNISICYKA